MFKRLEIFNWRQFEKIDISFHDKLTVITGANGSGKTTILNLLNRHFGWMLNFVSTPKRDKAKGILKYSSDFGKEIFESKGALSSNEELIGRIEYSEKRDSDLLVPVSVSQTYDVIIKNQVTVKGFHLPSHRSIYSYQSVGNIPTKMITREQAFKSYSNEIRNRYTGGGGKSQNYYLKETLISLGIFGYGSEEIVLPNKEAAETLEKFQSILRMVLPPKLGFQKIVIRLPEVVLITESGEFSLDAVSGGIAAIIDLAWQILLCALDSEPFVVTIDEPENHLYPEMQRTLLPNFVNAFPNAQFIIATHNPIIISSVQDSNVYVMNYNENNKVISTFLDMINTSGSSNEILRDVLGIQFTMPIWVEEKLEKMIEKYSSLEINEKNLTSLRNEMNSLGLDKLIPNTIADIVDRENKND